MTRNRIVRAAASIGASISICTIAFASNAWAGTDGYSATDGASVQFKHYGDLFEVCDLWRDGNAAMVEYNWDSNKAFHEDVNPGSAGSCHTFDHDFPELDSVYFHACEQIPYWPDQCANWIARTA
ncbi:hypothetical protein ACWHLZ_45800 [Streptomyces chartreusis]